MMLGISQTSTHSEPSSRVGVVSNVGMLCAGNAGVTVPLGPLVSVHSYCSLFEPRHEKTCLRGFRPG